MSVNLRLYEIAERFKSLEILESSEDLPPDLIRDTLESLECDFRDKAINVAYYIGNLRASADAIKAAAERQLDRAKRLADRADSLQSYLQFNMIGTGQTQIDCEHFVLKIAKNPPTVIIDHEASIPEKYWVQPDAPPKRLDRVAIGADIKAGIEVPGARRESFQRLEIK